MRGRALVVCVLVLGASFVSGVVSASEEPGDSVSEACRSEVEETKEAWTSGNRTNVSLEDFRAALEEWREECPVTVPSGFPVTNVSTTASGPEEEIQKLVDRVPDPGDMLRKIPDPGVRSPVCQGALTGTTTWWLSILGVRIPLPSELGTAVVSKYDLTDSVAHIEWKGQYSEMEYTSGFVINGGEGFFLAVPTAGPGFASVTCAVFDTVPCAASWGHTDTIIGALDVDGQDLVSLSSDGATIGLC